jgi:DNA polymerase-3 subunit alpha
MDAQREVFVTGASARGIEPALADTIFDAVAKFASYGFNKSHAAAYALLAYQTAYLKANHPVEFYAAAMTTECANQDKLSAYRNEMRQRGVPLYGPDVNASCGCFTVEDHGDGTGVRYALAAIKGVGEAAMDQLVQERQANGPFRNVFDLMARCGTRVINKRLLESLARAGAMDGLEPNRRRLVEGADLLLRYAVAAGEASDSSQVSLFGGSGAAQVPVPELPAVDDWQALERLQMEFDVLGLYLSAHPLDGYGAALTRLGVIPGDRLRQVAAAGENGRLKLAGVVIAKQERVTERTRFARVILSDPSAQFEVTVFSELLAQQRELLDGSAPLYLEVDARIDGDNLRLTVQRLQPLDAVADQGQPTVEIRLAAPAVALKLKPILERRGQAGARVRLVVPVPDGEEEEAILVLSDRFLLGTGQRLNVEGLPGVLAVRDLTRLH